MLKEWVDRLVNMEHIKRLRTTVVKDMVENMRNHVESVQTIVFEVDRQLYGTDILLLDEVVPMMAAQTVPNGPSFIKGMVNLRGRIIPVVDLRVYFGGQRRVYELGSRILITSFNDKCIGFIVDDVKEVEMFGNESIHPTVVESDGARFVRCLAKRPSGEVVQIIDLDRILDEQIFDQLGGTEISRNDR